MLETAAVTTGGAGGGGTGAPLSAATPIPLMDWERYTQLLAADILKEQSPRALLAARARVYELLVNCVPADTIIKRLSGFLIATGEGVVTGSAALPSTAATVMGVPGARPLPEEIRHEIAHWAAHYEHRLQMGNKELFHIEAFIVRVMAVVKAGPTGAFPSGGGAAGAGGSGFAR